ncbi:MAG: GNAT family N-acetyltransferase [Pseudomonadota bacterium]
MKTNILPAQLAHTSQIEALIQLSVRELSQLDYTTEQIESALEKVLGLDTQLIKDQTYFILQSGNEIVGCGGWSYRKTLFGSDNRQQRDNGVLDPKIDAAKIRAFFIHPHHVRKGLGKQLLMYCEQQAWDRGFTKLELGATLPGQRLYKNFGYIAAAPYDYEIAPNLYMPIVPMSKTLSTRPESE